MNYDDYVWGEGSPSGDIEHVNEPAPGCIAPVVFVIIGLVVAFVAGHIIPF